MTDWTAIIREHGALVWRCAYRVLGNQADSEDACQKTFLAAVEFEAKENIRNWPSTLSVLATRQALMLLRSRIRVRQRTQTLPVNLPKDPSLFEPGQQAQATELADHLRIALAEIDSVQAEVFCRVCLEGLTNQQAAAELGLTTSHVGVLLHRARAILKEKLLSFAPQKEMLP
ncbi:sigma-70 family RNA polymerase sigma factor [Telmatocola sphagniphila]|jgi:RNA polymerase sigma-70 factor (ECF subfamily)|uniref:Sigma-70 family RNA polymerase sigma factor n=1 Tax=Telmatocola sphagniphila TaxID=1123043 RepID=A0A8E6EZS7_9BACT|nr:sigma-70 family RNA polymerase sigma factor [Telmatocola sphagniphila]QVL34058.1 sigma-70 family RNA polymerase sigma factor [Telmatocola sphagniphila]